MIDLLTYDWHTFIGGVLTGCALTSAAIIVLLIFLRSIR